MTGLESHLHHTNKHTLYAFCCNPPARGWWETKIIRYVFLNQNLQLPCKLSAVCMAVCEWLMISVYDVIACVCVFVLVGFFFGDVAIIV